MVKKRLISLLLCASLAVTGSVTAYAEDANYAAAPEAAAEDDALIAERALLKGLKGMPKGFTLSSEKLDEKSKLRDYNVADSLTRLTPGVDYVSDQLVFCAESEEYAQTVAEAYNGRLVLFQYGIATIKIDTDVLSVQEAVRLGASDKTRLPAVDPNYIAKLSEPDEPGLTENDDELSADAAVAVSQSTNTENWEKWKNYFNDPALDPTYIYNSKDPSAPDKEGTPTFGYQWMHDAIGSYDAWKTTRGSSDIVVAVLDTGVDALHEDLVGHTTLVDDAIDVLDLKGNIIEPEDYQGHGTHVAGIIAATANNGVGGVGVAPGVSILGIPVFCKYNINSSTIAAAINYVSGYEKDGTDTGVPRANIINMSVGFNYYSAAQNKAINNAYKANITLCAAMGNENTNDMNFPACYDHVIGVVAINPNLKRSNFSTYGSWADIAAPGTYIFSTWNGHNEATDENGDPILLHTDHHDWYATWDGTSMAAPVVAGACALYMSAVGPVSPDEMEAVLKATATKTKDKDLGAGIVNVANLLPDNDKDTPSIVFSYYDNESEEYIDLPLEDGSDVEVISASAFLDLYSSLNMADNYVFTLNGSAPVINNGVTGKDTFISGNSIFLYPAIQEELEYDKKYTLKVAYVTRKGNSSKPVSISFTLKKPEDSDQPINYLFMYGAESIAAGKSATYNVFSSSPDEKTFNWSVSPVEGTGTVTGITVDKKGKVKVDKNAAPGTQFRLTVSSIEDPTRSYSMIVSVSEATASVKIADASGNVTEGAYIKNKKGEITGVRIYTIDIDSTKDIQEDTIDIILESTAKSGKATSTGYSFKSSSKDIADVSLWSRSENGSTVHGCRIRGLKAGKTKLTFTTNDGTNKKVSLNVEVIVPATFLKLDTAHIQTYIAAGRSTNLEIFLGETYGKPTITDIAWDYTVVDRYTKTDHTEQFKAQKIITISKTGKVTVNKKVEKLPDFYKKSFRIHLKGTTTDGTNYSDSIDLFIVKPVTKIGWALPGFGLTDVSYKNTSLYLLVDEYTHDSDEGLINRTIKLEIYCPDANYISNNYLLAESSNPEALSLRYYYYDYDKKAFIFNCLAYKPGKAKITITSNEGSGKKLTLSFNIVKK